MVDHNGVLVMQRLLLAGALGLSMAQKAAAILEGEPAGIPLPPAPEGLAMPEFAGARGRRAAGGPGRRERVPGALRRPAAGRAVVRRATPPARPGRVRHRPRRGKRPRTRRRLGGRGRARRLLRGRRRPADAGGRGRSPRRLPRRLPRRSPRPASRTCASIVAATAVTAMPAARGLVAAAETDWSRKPASSEPSGITPQAICRVRLLVRPSISFGVICITHASAATNRPRQPEQPAAERLCQLRAFCLASFCPTATERCDG